MAVGWLNYSLVHMDYVPANKLELLPVTARAAQNAVTASNEVVRTTLGANYPASHWTIKNMIEGVKAWSHSQAALLFDKTQGSDSKDSAQLLGGRVTVGRCL